MKVHVKWETTWWNQTSIMLLSKFTKSIYHWLLEHVHNLGILWVKIIRQSIMQFVSCCHILLICYLFNFLWALLSVSGSLRYRHLLLLYWLRWICWRNRSGGCFSKWHLSVQRLICGSLWDRCFTINQESIWGELERKKLHLSVCQHDKNLL